MAASAKSPTVHGATLNGDWTVVLPRRGRQRRKAPKAGILEEKQEVEKVEKWKNVEKMYNQDSQTDPLRETKLMQKVEKCITKVGSSKFYLTFQDQIETSVLDHFRWILGSEIKIQMVLEALGCSVISINEHGRREALKPTMFFMPHCEAKLYNNLLHANWKPELLSNMVIFGNSFETYEQHVSICKNSPILNSMEHILAVRSFTDEFRIKTISDDYYNAFHDSSWHFFGSVMRRGCNLSTLDGVI
ncbi:hypothetical protein RJT34_00542 [Clitoria ternatea]|uniref:SRR1-like domain-containing protein n=1 Tax=Clitoria ternatea TaxID=43366 RepID=A0AAN9KIG3_CLITE